MFQFNIAFLEINSRLFNMKILLIIDGIYQNQPTYL